MCRLRGGLIVGIILAACVTLSTLLSKPMPVLLRGRASKQGFGAMLGFSTCIRLNKTVACWRCANNYFPQRCRPPWALTARRHLLSGIQVARSLTSVQPCRRREHMSSEQCANFSTSTYLSTPVKAHRSALQLALSPSTTNQTKKLPHRQLAFDQTKYCPATCTPLD